jgi:hypothetical protein
LGEKVKRALPGAVGSTSRDHYQTDYYGWTLKQARALRDRRAEALDWDRLAEEVEDLGRSEKRSVKSQLVRLLLHLLKWNYQPRRRNESWRVSIENARDEIHDLLDDNPSLRPELEAIASKAYKIARRDARAETRLPDATFPQACPWAIEQMLSEDFWPEPKQTSA